MFEALAQRQTHSAEDGFLGHRQHRAGVATDPPDKIVHRSFKLSLRHKAVHHAEFQGSLSANGFASQNKLEGNFGSDEERQNSGGERRKNTNADFRLRKPSFRGGNHEIAKSRELSAAADGRSIHNADHGLADFQHSGKCGVKRVKHLKHALGSVFTNVDAAAKDLASGIENN